MQIQAWDKVASSVEFTLEPHFPMLEKMVRKDAVIVDFGCGYGRICQRLFELGYQKVKGLDSSSEMVARGKAQFPHLDISLHQFGPLPFPNNSVDAVVLCAVLTCVPAESDRRELMLEFRRVLKPGGTIHIAEFGRSPGRGYDADGCFLSKLGVRMKHFTTQEFKEAMVGFAELLYEERPAEAIGGNEAHGLYFVGEKHL